MKNGKYSVMVVEDQDILSKVNFQLTDLKII